jgi:GT2 family glycosyltransferase
MVYVPDRINPNGNGYFDHLFRYANRWDERVCQIREGLLTGALLGISRGCIDAIGLLDERYELTCEDVDYCLTAMATGLSVAYVGAAEAIHHEGKTRGRTVESKAEFPELNKKEERSLKFLFNKWPLARFDMFMVN